MPTFRFDSGPVRPTGSTATSVAGRIIGSIFGLVFLGVGLVITGAFAKRMMEGGVSWRWPQTSCQVLTSRVDDLLFSLAPEQAAAENHPYEVAVSYSWERDGRSYKGDHVGGTSKYRSRRDAEQAAARYPPGGTTGCFVDPANPTQASLRRPPLWGALVLLFPMIFVVVGAGIVIGVWSGGTRRRSRGADAPLSRSPTRSGRGCAVLAFGIFALAGAGFLIPFAIPAARIARSARWETVPATMLWSGVGSHSGSDSTTYSIDVLYEYDHGGARYRANRYDFFAGSSSGFESKQAIVASMPAGARVDAWVDPADPSNAVLHRSAGSWLWFSFIPLIFLAVGVGGMVLSLRGGRKAKAVDWLPDDDAASAGTERVDLGSGAGTVSAVAGAPGAAAGPILLQPAKSRVKSFVALLFFTLLWNGFIGVFIAVMVKQGEFGSKNGCATAAIGLFGLIGLLLLIALPRQFLMIFNPRAALTLASAPAPGVPVALGWRFEGASGRIKRLTILLEGREEATYRRGTDTTTVKNVFARSTLLDTADPGRVVGGETLLSLPADTMHSFSAPHNKIVWTLSLKGDIPGWPDIEDSVEVTVFPRGLVK
jgi:uncharacterized protein DUF3592